MGVFSGPEIVNDGLVFSYDMNNTAKSWRGKPTTNYAYNQNPRIDSSYAQWEPTADATWTANHPGRLVVYNDDGGAITGYINSGVNAGNWTVTHHAYWVYDDELKKPVVIMRDLDAQWKAKSWNMQQSMTSMGLAAGDTYTISWLQWTTNTGKSANAGLYGQNTSGQNGFHDGQSNAQTATAYNTKPYTWQRVYATFTVNAIRNMGATLSCYMYGYFGGRGVVKISDVQIEPGTVSGFSKTQNRSNIEALVDTVGSNIITASSLTYNTDGTFEFNGGNYALIPLLVPNGQPYTILMWVKPDTLGTSAYNSSTDRRTPLKGNGHWNPGIWATQNTIRSHAIGEYRDNQINWSDLRPSLIGMTFDGTTVNNVFDGVKLTGTRTAYSPGTPTTVFIGAESSVTSSVNWDGKIYSVYYYDRALSADEIKQNFENTRGKYGV